LAFASCNVVQFGIMIQHMTGKFPLSYNGYGCYCGLKGSKQPKDATDWCCHAHDCCYKRVSSSHCNPKTVAYKYSAQRGQITCGAGNSCQTATCACDKKAAECFRRTLQSYNNAYRNYPNFLCKGRTPSC
ncbi:Group IIE secretory phospholipase A2, partial [Acanthisitta chloris]